ncbi:Rieske 2Fe-2S domain-containing protein [Mycolicibacterium mengxianglii]|uniref:Rieske 2Fe-2S domain-containing protein n=1 Tax=Mycolicibacterium mengxianglii TaxID=2736649 RepID=UPI001E416A6B|nr:Rieske 2Fe-2S domain-containing protein [Mycolicibacterium mengxianglii]
MAHDAFTPEKLREAYQHVWFVVARSQDIDTPVRAQLLDQKLVVFRDATGTARVTDQRCIHRGGNLGNGKVVGENIECPYHGWQFNGGDGECKVIPSLAEGGRIPPKAKVKAYPVIERFEHVWTCLGDPVYDLPSPPEIEHLELEWRAAEPIHADCGFMAATENFRDMAHFPFVHEPSMGAVDPVVGDLDVQRDGREVSASYFYRQVQESDFSDVGDAWMHYHSYAPGIATILYDFGEDIGKRYLVDFPSPVSYDKCIIFWGWPPIAISAAAPSTRSSPSRPRSSTRTPRCWKALSPRKFRWPDRRSRSPLPPTSTRSTTGAPPSTQCRPSPRPGGWYRAPTATARST